MLRYRTVRKLTRVATTGKVSLGDGQYLARRGVEAVKRHNKRVAREEARLKAITDRAIAQGVPRRVVIEELQAYRASLTRQAR